MKICLACSNPNQISAFCTSCGKKLGLQDRYFANRVIGQGGFGRTFLAIDEAKPSRPKCVIKQFIYNDTSTKAKALELFDEEAKRLDDLGQHSQIPALMSHCQQDGLSYLVQEFIDGENLQTELERNGAFSEAEVRDVLGQILRILDYIHRQQVIHRDIKPENIMRRRSDRQLVLVDFGAAKHATATALAKTGTTIGSASYAAPEQSRGRSTFSSDLYSLGVTCMHLLTGVDPFTLFDDLSLGFAWRDFLNGKSVSTEFGQVLDKLTQHRPVDRYGSAGDALTALGNPSPQTNPSVSRNETATTRQPTPNRIPNHSPLQLKSARGIDYSELEKLLKVQEWRKADELTAELMLKVLDPENQGWLDGDSISSFPCKDLRTIDQLWVYYSNAKFGFSIQKKLWLECGGEIGKYDYEVWKIFAAKVGWYNPHKGDWRTYTEFMLDTKNAQDSLLASLPARFRGGGGMQSRGEAFFFRAETCEL